MYYHYYYVFLFLLTFSSFENCYSLLQDFGQCYINTPKLLLAHHKKVLKYLLSTTNISASHFNLGKDLVKKSIHNRKHNLENQRPQERITPTSCNEQKNGKRNPIVIWSRKHFNISLSKMLPHRMWYVSRGC